MAGITNLRAREVVRPLRATFSTSRGHKQHIHSVIVKVCLDSGQKGRGEVPTSFTYPDETIEAIRATIRVARPELRGLPIEDYGPWIKGFRSRFPRAMMAVSGLETALFRARLAQEQASEYAFWGGKAATVETDITIPLLPDARFIEGWVGWAVGRGFRTFKVKVGGDMEKDRALVSLVRRTLDTAMAAGFRLRLDGNQGYNVGTFLAFVSWLEKERYNVELFEQPLEKDDFRGLEKIRGRSPIPIILDEGVRSVEHAQRVIDNGLCDGINVKIAKSGIEGSRKIAGLAKKHGKKLMAGCMTETMVGASAGMWMALGRGDIDYVDLDGPYLLYGSPRYPGLALKGPLIEVV